MNDIWYLFVNSKPDRSGRYRRLFFSGKGKAEAFLRHWLRTVPKLDGTRVRWITPPVAQGHDYEKRWGNNDHL